VLRVAAREPGEGDEHEQGEQDRDDEGSGHGLRIAETPAEQPLCAPFGAVRGYPRFIFARPLHSSAWLIPVGAALIYFASLSAVLVEEWEEPRLLVVAFLGPSLLAGLVIKRFSALVLPLAVIAVSRLWVPMADEDPILAMIGGLFVGVLLARAFERTQPLPRSEAAQTDARAHRSPAVRRAMKRVVSRQAIDDLFDAVRFRIDTFPQGVYQPVPSLPVRSATRGIGSESRWQAILPVVREHVVESAVDIGACEGYFSIMLGEADIPTIALEGNPTNYRTAIFAVRRNRLENVGVLALELNPDNVVAVPASDCTLCLSVWHHFVRYYGLEGASGMLERIWDRTSKVLFFDTGENEMTPEYGLPAMTPDPRSWLTAYLAETCPGSRIEHLGTHLAFDPTGRPCERNLFAVIRV
jgi:hypothetical protein